MGSPWKLSESPGGAARQPWDHTSQQMALPLEYFDKILVLFVTLMSDQSRQLYLWEEDCPEP